jgi:hypothetical protein
MTKVIKVIVDEIVDGCWNCDLLHRVDGSRDENGRVRYLCSAHGFIRTTFNIDVNDRPDWCPLVRKDLYDMEIIQNFVGKESEE